MKYSNNLAPVCADVPIFSHFLVVQFGNIAYITECAAVSSQHNAHTYSQLVQAIARIFMQRMKYAIHVRVNYYRRMWERSFFWCTQKKSRKFIKLWKMVRKENTTVLLLCRPQSLQCIIEFTSLFRRVQKTIWTGISLTMFSYTIGRNVHDDYWLFLPCREVEEGKKSYKSGHWEKWPLIQGYAAISSSIRSDRTPLHRNKICW